MAGILVLLQEPPLQGFRRILFDVSARVPKEDEIDASRLYPGGGVEVSTWTRSE